MACVTIARSVITSDGNGRSALMPGSRSRMSDGAVRSAVVPSTGTLANVRSATRRCRGNSNLMSGPGSSLSDLGRARTGKKRRLLPTMLDTVCVDAKETRSIVAMASKPFFRPVFQVAATREGRQSALKWAALYSPDRGKLPGQRWALQKLRLLPQHVAAYSAFLVLRRFSPSLLAALAFTLSQPSEPSCTAPMDEYV